MASPFVFQQPLAPEDLRGREEEIAAICGAVTAGNAIAVAAPRRYGKTSVLVAVQHRLAEAGHAVALVDLYGTASLAELAVRLERAWAATRPRWRKVADRVLRATNLGVSLSGPGIGLTLTQRPATDPLPALHALLDLPHRLRTEAARAVVLFDEFQSLNAVEGAEGLLRSHLQHHRAVAGYAFAGSEPHLLDRQFDDPDRPFFGQALRLRLGRPSRVALAEVIEQGFQRTGRDAGEALGVLLAAAEDHPQRAMLLAHFVWEAADDGGEATLETWDDALMAARSQVAGEVQARFDRATSNQQRALRLLAHRLPPFAVAGRARVGLDAGSVTSTVRSLVRDGLVEQANEASAGTPVAGDYRIVDPLLGDWIRRVLPL